MYNKTWIICAALAASCTSGDDWGGWNTTIGGSSQASTGPSSETTEAEHSTASSSASSDASVTSGTSDTESTSDSTGAGADSCAKILEVFARPTDPSIAAAERWIIVRTAACQPGDPDYSVELGDGKVSMPIALGPIPSGCVGVGMTDHLEGIDHVDHPVHLNLDLNAAFVTLYHAGVVVDQVELPSDVDGSDSLPNLPARRRIDGTWSWMLGPTIGSCAWAP